MTAIDEFKRYAHDLIDQIKNFVDAVYDAIARLQGFPEMGLVMDENGVRSVLVRPYTRIYYEIDNQFISILRLTDTRCNPKN
jgi:plasmid stabilization system protein ParE